MRTTLSANLSRFILSLTVVFLTCISAQIASAQENVPVRKSYIYCIVNFDAVKVEKVEKIHNLTRTYKEWECTMHVDCRQDDSDIKGFRSLVKDAEGNNKTFRSTTAGLNWLGMKGWELLPYPVAYDPRSLIESDYWFRMEVTGLSTEQINEILDELK